MLHHTGSIPEPGDLIGIIPAAVADGLQELRFQDGEAVEDLSLRAVRFAEQHLEGQPAWPVNVSDATETVYKLGNDDGQNAVQIVGPFNVGLFELAAKPDRLQDDVGGGAGD